MAHAPDSGSADELVTDRIEGLFYKHQIPGLFVSLARKRCSGRLVVTQGAVIRTVGVVDGLPVSAMSSLAAEHLGNRLVAQGRLTAAQAVMAESLMRTEGIRFGEALLRLDFFNQPDLNQVLGDQRNWIIGKCLEANGLRTSFRPADVVSEIDSPVPLLAVIETKVSGYSPSEVEALTKRLSERVYLLSADAYDLARRLGASKKIFDVLSAATSGSFRIQDLVASSSGRIPVAAMVTVVLCGLASPTAESAAPSPLTVEHTPSNPSATRPSTMVRLKGKASGRAAPLPEFEEPLDSSPVNNAATQQSWNARPGVPLPVYYLSSVLALLGGIAIGVALFFVLSRSAQKPLSPPAPVTGTPSAGESPEEMPLAQPVVVPGENPGVADELPQIDDNAPPLADQPGAVSDQPGQTERPAPRPTATPRTPTREPEPAAAPNPEEIAFRMAIVKKMLEQRDYKRAVTVAREVLGFDPRNAGAYLDLGLAYSSLGSHELACQSFRRYLRLAGDAPERAEVERQVAACEPAATPSP